MKSFLISCFVICSTLQVLSAKGFIPNEGQFKSQDGGDRKDLLFVLNAKQGLQIQLRKTGYSYEYFSFARDNSIDHKTKKINQQTFLQADSFQINRVDIDFVNANPFPNIVRKKNGSTINYYYDHTFLKVEECETVTYEGIYPGIDLQFFVPTDATRQLKYNVIIHPGANLHLLCFKVTGAIPQLVANQLVLALGTTKIIEQIPLCYYEENGQSEHALHFSLKGDQFFFEGAYDTLKTLVIDPVSNLVWATYQGGAATDVCMAMGVDGLDNSYITGYTSSSSNIASIGAFQSTLAGSLDIFLSKFDKNGQRIWTTYFGGPNVDIAYAMYVQNNGTCYLAGATNSTINLVTPGVHQTVYGGGINDIVLARFDSNGQKNWATYYGGAEHDIIQAITCDRTGNILIAGHSESTVNIATPGAYQTVYNFNYDVCLAKFSPTGQQIWGTYYGDSGIDEAYGIAVDDQKSVYITGGTTSISGISTNPAHQLNPGGANDAFIAKFDSTGSTLIWGSYFGGVANDAGTALEVGAGTLFIGGNTSSTNNIASAGAEQAMPNSFDETFIGAFSLNGSRLWCTYFGGEGTDYIWDLCLTKAAEVLVCGASNSSANISTTGAYQATLGSLGYYDAFLAKFSPQGNRQLSTYLGGEADDIAHGIGLDGMGSVYIAGETTSTASLATVGAFQTASAGAGDAFLAKFCIPYKTPIFPASSATYCPGAITFSSVAGYGNYLWSNGVQTNPMVVNIFATGNYKFSLQTMAGPECVGTSDTITISVRSCLGVETIFRQNNLFTLAPNPCDGMLEVSLNSEGQNFHRLFVYDQNGKCVNEISIEGAQELTLNISNFPAGIYLMKIETDQGFLTRKFIKQ